MISGRGNARHNAHPDFDNIDEGFIYDWFQNKRREWENKAQCRGTRKLASPSPILPAMLDKKPSISVFIFVL